MYADHALDHETVIHAAENADLDPTDIHPAYSGRGCYGAYCWGMILPRDRVSRFLVELALELAEHDDADTARELAGAARTDDMGLDTIVYFPGWLLTDEDGDLLAGATTTAKPALKRSWDELADTGKEIWNHGHIPNGVDGEALIDEINREMDDLEATGGTR